MIIVMKQNAPLTAVENLETELNNRGFKVSRSQGESKVVLGLIGDTFKLDERDFLGNEWVEKVMRVQEPYKRASRSFHPQNSIIDVSGVKVGGKKLVVMADHVPLKLRNRFIPWHRQLRIPAHLFCVVAHSSPEHLHTLSRDSGKRAWICSLKRLRMYSCP